MGKTSKPCTILVTDRALFQDPAMQALREKGHAITYLNLEEGVDVVLGPQCWRVEQGLGETAAILEMVLKGVRAKKRG